ncbi:ABC transporter ATP-binding protein [Roseomonas sp. CCTCC AB2023176]|uniref:ABC transporter ATP-binding protein n=1 Tax=Roseomonas sp. CCTCC AB2023176 TaxID=3342640 RepID=UPI0035D806F0
MTAEGPALAVEGLHAAYGSSRILRGVDLTLPAGAVLALLGRNGAGKTTTLRAVMGLVPARTGTVRLFGRAIGTASPVEITRAGMSLVLEDRGVFPSLSVEEALAVAAMRRKGVWTTDRILALFPRLGERLRHRCGQLSGGEQQMLAIGRALLLNPRVLLLDEPTQGLAPIIVRELLERLGDLRREGMSIVLVEQNLAFARRLADEAAVLGKGAIQWTGAMKSLRDDDPVIRAWLSV